MSVKMALAKLCAFTCGGAIVGGGAVHMAETAQAERIVTKRVVQKRVAAKRAQYPGTGKKLVRRTITKTAEVCEPQTVTVTTQGAPIPIP
ncbi:MAG TPA: hypothetical protein VL973_02785, partial [Sphingomonas sp.]|nr:hypothetical protein [Sphingomonas sp.]